MSLRSKTWSTTNVHYAVKKYVCLLDLPLPEGTACKDGDKQIYFVSHEEAQKAVDELRICLVTSDIENSYWRPPEGVYSIIGFASHSLTYVIPTENGPIDVGIINRNLTREQVDALLPLCIRATVLENYSGNNPELDPELQCTVGNWDMMKVVSKLQEACKVKVRYTDHEFRDDVRNLTWIEGYDLTGK